MELLQLKYFKDAAELENFSLAAKKNMVPQPSISYAVKKLEEELGVQLFDRCGRKIRLNDYGTYFYKKVSTILNTIDECKIHFSGIDQQELIIYIQDGDFFISHLAADFCAKYPNIHISYATVDEVLNSSGTPFDFTFMQPICDLSDYNYELLLEDELIAIVSLDNPLSQYDEIDIAMLKSENFIGLYDTIPIRTVTDNFCREVGHFTPNYVFKSHEDFATIYRVSKNAGVAILPHKYYNIHPSNDVKVIKIKNTIYSKLIIAWSKERILSVPEKAFLEYCKQWFKAL